MSLRHFTPTLIDQSRVDLIASAYGASAGAALYAGMADAWDAFDRIMMAGAERALADLRATAERSGRIEA